MSVCDPLSGAGDSGECWRLLPFHSGRSEHHLALGDALVRQATVPTAWWHTNPEPTVILGAGQTLKDIDIESCRQRGVRIVRRQAGGTAVFAGPGVVGLDVVLPAGHPGTAGDILATYEWMGTAWVKALELLGVKARMVSVEEARRNAQSLERYSRALRLACFGSLSPYEVVVGDRKLVGLAQVRRRSGVSIQAGIHLHFDARGLASLLPRDPDDCTADVLERAAVGLSDLCAGALSVQDMFDAFHTALFLSFGISLSQGAWTLGEVEYAQTQLRLQGLEDAQPISVSPMDRRTGPAFSLPGE